MPEPPLIAHWIWNLSLGGDAKNLCALALEQRRWARINVLTRSTDPGVRSSQLKGSSIDIVGGIDKAGAVNQYLESANPIAVIIHRNGRTDAVETEVLRAFAGRGIACFEFNTFGRADETTDELWAAHFFPSRSCLLQYAQRRNRSVGELPNVFAPGYSVAVPEPITEGERKEAREQLGIGAVDLVVSRLVRPDLRKWDPMPVVSLERARARKLFSFTFIVQSPPPIRAAWIRRNLGDSALILDPTDDAETLRRTMAASDCLVNCANIGETFGLAMAEAMACGLPVIVNSTPKADNAQIELCRHMETGIVANSVGALTESFRILAEDPSLRERLGANAREFMSHTFAPAKSEFRVRKAMREVIAARDTELSNQILLPPHELDTYLLDDAALQELARRDEFHLEVPVQTPEAYMAETRLRLLRLCDAVDYARSLDRTALASTLMRRLRRRSLGRD